MTYTGLLDAYGNLILKTGQDVMITDIDKMMDTVYYGHFYLEKIILVHKWQVVRVNENGKYDLYSNYVDVSNLRDFESINTFKASRFLFNGV